MDGNAGARRWPAWAAGATLAFACVTVTRFIPLSEGPYALLLLAAFAWVCLGWGELLLKGLGRACPSLDPARRACVALTLGLGAAGLGAFGLAACGAFTVPAVLVLAVPGALAALAPAKALLPELGAPGTGAGPLWAAAASLAALLWCCLVPPHQYDSLVYHLPLAQGYVRTGSLAAPPGLLYAHFPQNGDMLFALALLLKSDVLAQMLSWLATALTLAWLWSFGARAFGRMQAALACALLATHTSTMLLSSTTYVETIVMLWVTAALFCLWAGVEERRRGWFALAGAFIGLALGAKYTAGIAAALLGVGMAARAARPGPDRRARAVEAAWFIGTASALFLPWLLKNALAVGNPVFPFLYEHFAATKSGWSAEAAQKYFGVMTEYKPQGKLLRDAAALPFELLSGDIRFGRGMDVLGGLGWELMFWCVPLAVWAARRSRALMWLLAFSAGYVVLWFATGTVLRFLATVAPGLCLAAAVGLAALWGRLGRGGRASLAAALAGLTAVHLFLFLFVHALVGSGRTLFAFESRDEYLHRRLDYYPCARFATDALALNDRILIVGEQRAYYLDREHRASTVNGPNPFVAWANEAQSPRALAARMSAEGFSHALFVPREFERLESAFGAFSPRGRANVAGLAGAVKPAFSAPQCSLLPLR